MRSTRRSKEGQLARPRLVLAVLVLVAVALGAGATGALAAKVNIVRQGEPPAGKIPTRPTATGC
jgi:hypothetical protein